MRSLSRGIHFVAATATQQLHACNNSDLTWKFSSKLILSRIRGAVASYLASQARDPWIDSHQHQKDSCHIWRHLRNDTVFSCNLRCLLIFLHGRSRTYQSTGYTKYGPPVQLACVLGRWAVFRITCTFIVNMCGMSLVISINEYIHYYNNFFVLFRKKYYRYRMVFMVSLSTRTCHIPNIIIIVTGTGESMNCRSKLHYTYV